MSASHAPALDAIAFQLAGALETYDASVQRMVDCWLDMDQYRNVGEQVEAIRMYSAALPELSVAWVELLIAHAELVHCLWRDQHAVASADDRTLAQVRAHHTTCVATLRGRALRVIGGSG